MRIFVIEGLDGSGKTTQCEMLKKKFTVVKFPNDSKLIQKYLNKEYGEKVNPYAVSSLFAIDRYLTLSKFREHQTIICDRYITSNFIYQPKSIIRWIERYEYELLGIPKPEGVIFLNMPPKFANKLIKKRGTKRDIYESNYKYLKEVYKRGLEVAKERSWFVIDCVENNEIKSPENIHKEILERLEYWVYKIAF